MLNILIEKVITSRVLVLVNSDVDGVCATKILQYLFKVRLRVFLGKSTSLSNNHNILIILSLTFVPKIF